jgi:hypothetical protein
MKAKLIKWELVRDFSKGSKRTMYFELLANDRTIIVEIDQDTCKTYPIFINNSDDGTLHFFEDKILEYVQTKVYSEITEINFELFDKHNFEFCGRRLNKTQ